MVKLLGKPVVEILNERNRARIRRFNLENGRPPRLTVVLVGQDPASVIYVRKKGEAAASLGIESETVALAASSTPEQVRLQVERLNRDPNVDGILIQRPLPPTFAEEEVVFWVSPEKDVDAFHPVNAGKLILGLPSLKPCTPSGIIALLDYYGIHPEGKLACVVGRSSIVGKPMAALLLQANATVLHCHSKTVDLKALTSQAEILVIAAGKPGLVDASFVRPGAVVVDVGIHRDSSGRVVGDVLYSEVSTKASAITPVPGGVGPVTIALLLENTLTAAENRMRK